MTLNKILKYPKILAFSSFFMILILSFILFGKLINVNQAVETDISMGAAYVLVSFIVLLSLTLLWLIMQITAESKTKEEYLQKTTESPVDEAVEETSANGEQDNETEQIDIETIEEKLIPSNGQNLSTGQLAEKILTNIADEYDIVQGLFYVRNENSDTFGVAGKFAYYGEEEPKDFEFGVALTGQTAKNQKVLNLTKIPENYITVLSGLGEGSPNGLLLVPVVHNQKTTGLVELASFRQFDRKTEDIFTQLSEKIGKRLSETT